MTEEPTPDGLTLPRSGAARREPSMSAPAIRLLLVEDSQGDVLILRESLTAAGPMRFQLRHVERLGEALERLRSEAYDVVLLDLGLPDSRGLATLEALRVAAPEVPVVVLTGLQDQELGVRALQAGAQDYLGKGQGDGPFLGRSIRYAIERKRAQSELFARAQELEQANIALRALGARLDSVREQESTRLARELHDELGQAMTGLKLDLARIGTSFAEREPLLAAKTRAMQEQIDDMFRLMHDIARRLRPVLLDDLGLLPAIDAYAGDLCRRAGLRCELIANVDAPSLAAPRLSTVIFRIVQEALINITRHAQATRVDISLHQAAGHITLEVRDNGRGLVPGEEERGDALGIVGMRERALSVGGELTVEGFAGRGTVVALRIAMPQPVRAP